VHHYCSKGKELRIGLNAVDDVNNNAGKTSNEHNAAFNRAPTYGIHCKGTHQQTVTGSCRSYKASGPALTSHICKHAIYIVQYTYIQCRVYHAKRLYHRTGENAKAQNAIALWGSQFLGAMPNPGQGIHATIQGRLATGGRPIDLSRHACY